MRQIPEWEELRRCASQIKAHTLSHLADYLVRFEEQATRRGAVVHWAKDAEEHNRIVHEILSKRGVRRLVKSKSMLTEECHLNPYLERHGIEVIDTDLGERIVQLANEPPSHIVLPAIHKKKEDVSEIFRRHLGTEPGNADPKYLAEAARQHLRQAFLKADAALTGVNFAAAETGGIVVCTNEGNADLGVALPRRHIACMGIEKLIPAPRDLAVFLRLLARSATGQPITTYSSHFHGPPRWGRTAHRHRRRRPERDPGERRVPRVSPVYPLRRVHEHLPGVSPKRRPQLPIDSTRADRLRAGADAGSRGPMRACRTPAACAHRARTCVRSKSRSITSFSPGERNSRKAATLPGPSE